MILLKEYKSVLYTVEWWQLPEVRVTIEFFPNRPHVATSLIWSEKEALVYCIRYIQDGLDRIMG